MKPRVFILECNKDADYYAPAEVHGDLLFIVGRVDRRPSIWSSDLDELILKYLEENDFNPARDHIGCVGNIVTTIRMTALVISKYDKASFLLFDSKMKAYRATTLPTAL